MEKKVEIGRISKILKNEDGRSWQIEISFVFRNELFNYSKSIKTNNSSFQVGDFIRLNQENEIEKILDLEKITYDDFDEICKRFKELTEEELKRYHQFLLDKSYGSNDSEESAAYTDMYLDELSKYNYNHKTKEIQAFLNSKYVSQYYLNKIKEILENTYNRCNKEFSNILEYMKSSDIPDYKQKYLEVNKIIKDRKLQNISEEEMDKIYELLTNEIEGIKNSRLNNNARILVSHFDIIMEFLRSFIGAKKVLNSDRDLQSLSGQEIKLVMFSLENASLNGRLYDKYAVYSKLYKFYDSFFSLLFNVESNGTKEYLGKYADNRAVAARILQSADISAMCGEPTIISENQLKEMFQKISDLDEKKALATYHFIENIDSFNVYNFAKKFLELAAANYGQKFKKNQETSFWNITENRIGNINFFALSNLIRRKKQEILGNGKNELLRQKFLNQLSTMINEMDLENNFSEDSKRNH